MKRIILSLTLLIGVVNFQFSTSNFLIGFAKAQLPYGYAPLTDNQDELAGLGGGKSQFVQGMVLFDPALDPVLTRLKGEYIRGVRCYMRADYKQARQNRSAVLASTGSIGNIVRTKVIDLCEGWNDVTFDEPLIIGDEKIYLGVQAYETLGTPYPLVAYAPAVVPQSCWINQGKKTWEEYTDRGTLLIFALLDEDLYPNIERTAYAQNTTHPQTVAPESDFDGGLYLHNFSAEPITSVEIAMQGEGATSPTLRTLQLDTPVEPFGGTVITTKLRSGATEGTSVGWTASVTKVNGREAQAGRPGTTELYVTHDNFIRTPLVEEFTSQYCVNCPQMAYYLEKALKEYGSNYVYVSHHTGFREDGFTTQPDREIVYVFGGYEKEYNPAIMYNRAILDGESQIIQGIRDMSPTPYLEALALAADMPAMADVNIEQENNEIHVSGRVARDLVSKPLYLSCYLVEDGISTDQYFQKGMDDADAPADLKDVFHHNGIILHYFTENAIGDLLTPEANGSFSVSFPQTEKQGFGGTRRRLVAFVHKVNKSDPRENVVLNATQLTLGTDGISSVDNGELEMGNEVFDLTGRRISGAKKGLFIKGNKKVIIR